MPKKINLFLKSYPTDIINKRFLVKASIMDTGVVEPSIMVVVNDMLSKHFKILFCKDDDALKKFLTALHMVGQ